VIRACKFEDSDGNGIFDAGERLLPDWPMALVGEGQALTGQTGSDGCTIFTVAPGTYTVSEGQLSGYAPTTDTSRPVTVGGSTAFVDVFFGNRRVEQMTPIHVCMFEDTDGNATKESGE
jgi:hypothetical protein